MITLRAFPWARLSASSSVVHRVDESGRLVLRGVGSAAPFTTFRVRDGKGGFQEADLGARGFEWTAVGADAWELRTKGDPVTMGRTESLWSDLVRDASAEAGIDERIVLTMIGSETGSVGGPDAQGLVRAPRTEKGYPERTGESDPGDARRDALDWKQSGGMKSSHGLMQTLIGTAAHVRPDLFAGVPVARYREVLWQPAASIAAGVAAIVALVKQWDQSLSALGDPLAVRMIYAGSYATTTAANRWGVGPLYDELVPLLYVAFWNDDASVRRAAGGAVAMNRGGDNVMPVAFKRDDHASSSVLHWLFGITGLALASAATVAALSYANRHHERA